MAVNGQYEAGFAMLVSTDFRVLLIDKKPKYLTLKDIRFDMITELDFAARMVNSTIRIYTPNKELRFASTNSRRLRKLFTYTQHKVMEIRHRFMMQQFAREHEMKNIPPGVAMAYMVPQPLSMPAEQAELPPMAPPPIIDTPVTKTMHLPAESTMHLYNPQPEPDEPSEEHKRLAAALGAAGLQSIVHVVQNGRVVKEYMTIPFQQRWRKRPYGFSRDPLPQQTQSS
jgi:hypothetical protein